MEGYNDGVSALFIAKSAVSWNLPICIVAQVRIASKEMLRNVLFCY